MLLLNLGFTLLYIYYLHIVNRLLIVTLQQGNKLPAAPEELQLSEYDAGWFFKKNV